MRTLNLFPGTEVTSEAFSSRVLLVESCWALFLCQIRFRDLTPHS